MPDVHQRCIAGTLPGAATTGNATLTTCSLVDFPAIVPPYPHAKRDAPAALGGADALGRAAAHAAVAPANEQVPVAIRWHGDDTNAQPLRGTVAALRPTNMFIMRMPRNRVMTDSITKPQENDSAADDDDDAPAAGDADIPWPPGGEGIVASVTTVARFQYASDVQFSDVALSTSSAKRNWSSHFETRRPNAAMPKRVTEHGERTTWRTVDLPPLMGMPSTIARQGWATPWVGAPGNLLFDQAGDGDLLPPQPQPQPQQEEVMVVSAGGTAADAAEEALAEEAEAFELYDDDDGDGDDDDDDDDDGDV